MAAGTVNQPDGGPAACAVQGTAPARDPGLLVDRVDWPTTTVQVDSPRGAVGRVTGGHIVKAMTDAAPSPPDLAPAWPPGEIVPGVWQSGSPQPGEHWDAVIDLDGSAPPLEGIALYVHWLIEDGPAPERAVLVALADLVNDMRRVRKHVLRHCAGGINRSGLLSAAALMRDGMSATEAIETIRLRRPGALNNREFVRLLIEGF